VRRYDARARTVGFERSGVAVFLSLRLRAKGAETPAARDRERCGDAPRLSARRGLGQRRNPMDGSGPRGREAGGEGTVEEVRNLEDGSCRGGNPREERTRQPTSSKGEGTPGGEGLGRDALTRNAEECPERASSLRESLRTFGSRGRPDDGTPRGRTARRGGSGGPSAPLRRTEWNSERRRNPARVAWTAATTARALRVPANPWRGVRRPACSLKCEVYPSQGGIQTWDR
jgi:hypothetical protein